MLLDPRYELKGAARAAQEHYRPPGYRSPVDPVNLFEKLKHDLWTHPAGNTYLQTMRELGLAYHNIGGKTRDASKIFEEILGLDPDDHQVTLISSPRLHHSRISTACQGGSSSMLYECLIGTQGSRCYKS